MTTQQPTSDTSSKRTDRQTERTLWQRLIARLQGREDSEHEQILIRIGIALAILIYLMAAGERSDSSFVFEACMTIGGVYLLGSILLFAHLLWRAQVSEARRYAGIFLDLTTLPTGMIVGGALVAPLYPMFLWISFGMGFRYGRRYLFAAAALSLLSFGIVIGLSDYWRAQPLLSASLWLALIVLPAYASTLLAKLTTALNRAEEASQAKSRFVASMSHEFRTPLNAIIGMSDLLNEERLPMHQRDMTRTIQSAGQTLLDMVDDVLSITRLESTNFTTTNVDFDLHKVLATVCHLHQQTALEKGIGLRLRVDTGMPFRLHGSARGLTQILTNLLTNAIKFTDHGHVTIQVSGKGVDRDRVALLIDVNDTGIGIPIDAQGRIFDQFVQANEATQHDYGGTGLGLAIARQLASMMGGTLILKSSSEAGSSFSLEIPFDRLPDAPLELDGDVVVLGDLSATGSYCRRLTSWGARVTAASSVSEIPTMYRRPGCRPWALFVLTSEAALQKRRHVDEDIEPAVSNNAHIILMGVDTTPSDVDHLAVLPHAHSHRDLFNAAHAALTSPFTAENRRTSARHRSSDRSCKILVADDNPINRKVIKKMLQHGGHTAIIANNGDEMLDLLASETVDLVLFDLNMPGLAALDAVSLHRFGAGDHHPPFVALTADATEESRRRCIDAGIDGYLTKPAKLDELLDLVLQMTETSEPASPSGDDNIVVRHPHFAAGQPVVDRRYLDRLRALDQGDGFLKDVITDFIDDTEKLIGQIDAAATACDAAAFRETAHALRSSAAYMGAKAFVDLCQGWRGITIDELQREGRTHIERIEVEFERLRDVLASIAKEEASLASESHH